MSTSQEWEREITSILDQDYDLLEELLLTKNTSTTKYERYLGPRAIIAHTFSHKDAVELADFGCGGNYGLTGIAMHRPFHAAQDHTPDTFVTTYSTEPLKLKYGLAADLDDPYEPNSINWRMACSFYPSELNGDGEFPHSQVLNTQLENIDFLKGDVTHIPIKKKTSHEAGLPENAFDAIIMCTLLYQHSPSVQSKILENARKALKETGILVIQDFARVDQENPEKLSFKASWFGKDFGYRTFVAGKKTNWKMLEVFQWKNGRCAEVKPGKDFKQYATIFSKNS